MIYQHQLFLNYQYQYRLKNLIFRYNLLYHQNLYQNHYHIHHILNNY